MNKKTAPFKLDNYRSRSKRVDYLDKPDNVYARKITSLAAVILFVCIDFFCLKVVWNLVQTEEPLYIYCVALASAVALDVPLAIAANALKRYHQGLYSRWEKNLVMILSVAVFMITFVFSFGFRIFTRDLSFDIGTGSTLTNTLSATAETDTGSPLILFAALFNGVIPLLTSISSFVISYWGYDPLGIKLGRLEKTRIGLQANIHEAEKALAETMTSEEYCCELISREDDLYKEFLGQLYADTLALKQMVRVLIMKKPGTPEHVSAMSKAGAELEKKCGAGNALGEELPRFIEGQLNSNDKVITTFTNHAA